MIIRCDSCSVSLQLDEDKIPTKNFTVRCPRCQNLIRVQKGSTVQQLVANGPAPELQTPGAETPRREADSADLNLTLKALLGALKGESGFSGHEPGDDRTRRVLLCLGEKRDEVANLLVKTGFKVYIAENPAQANERLRDGKTEILILSADFAAEFGGASIMHQKVNSMQANERRRLFYVALEREGTTLSAHEAFVKNLNLVVNVADTQQLPIILNRALRDFNELYRNFNVAAGTSPI
jgi:predicted Zn finger-like uncharacterized protein